MVYEYTRTQYRPYCLVKVKVPQVGVHVPVYHGGGLAPHALCCVSCARLRCSAREDAEAGVSLYSFYDTNRIYYGVIV